MKAVRWIVGLLLISALTLSIIGCKNEDGLITIWAWNKNVDILQDAVERYQDVNPDFNAEVVSYSSGDIDQKFKSASQQKNGGNYIADILLGDAINMRAYIAQWEDIFVNFAEYGVTEEFQNQFVRSTIDLVKYGDKLYAMPYGIGPTVVFAYIPLWEKTDLEKVRAEGWTWEEYIEIGEKLKQKLPDCYMSAYNMRSDDRLYRTMVSQLGEWFMDKDLNVQVGNPNSISAMTMIKEMYDTNLIKHFDTGTYQTEMATGKIAAEIHGFSTSGQIKSAAPDMNGNWEILPCPSWTKGGNSASITGGSYLYVNNSISEDKKQNCIDFVKWYTLSDENVLQGLKIGGIYTPYLPAYDTDFFNSSTDDYFNGQKVYKDVADYTKSAIAIYPSEFFEYNLSVFTSAQEQILFNGQDIKTQLDIAKNAMNSNKLK